MNTALITAQVVIVFCLLIEINVSSGTYETLKITKEDETQKYLFGVYDDDKKTIAVNDHLLVIGSPKDMGLQGSVDIFSRKHNKRIGKLRPPSSSQKEKFGFCVTLNDDLIVVGVGWYVNKVYVYSTSEPFELLHTIQKSGSFGRSCSIDPDNTLVVGAPRYNTFRGAAFVYNLNNLFHEQSVPLIHTLQPMDRLVNDYFGDTVITTTNYIAADTWKGNVYVFNKNSDRLCKVEPQNEDIIYRLLAINDDFLLVNQD
jgi:hypothetical protein